MMLIKFLYECCSCAFDSVDTAPWLKIWCNGATCRHLLQPGRIVKPCSNSSPVLLLGVKQVFKREGLSTVYLILPLTRTHQEKTMAVNLEETKKKA
jgi:hypothetical protein